MDGVISWIEQFSLLITVPIALFSALGLLILIISPLVPIIFQVAYSLKYYKYNQDIEKSPRLNALKRITRKSYLNIAFVFVLLLPLFNHCETNFEEKYKVAVTSLSPTEQEDLGEKRPMIFDSEYTWSLSQTEITVTKLGKIDSNDSVPVYKKNIWTYSGIGMIGKGMFEIYSLIEGDNLAGEPQFGSTSSVADIAWQKHIHGSLIDNNVRHHGILNESTDNQSSNDIYALPLRDVIILICFNLIILFYVLWVYEIFNKGFTLFTGFKEEEEIKVSPTSILPLIMLILYLVFILTFLFTGVFTTLRAGSFILGLIIFAISEDSLGHYFQKT